jgi:hypothetical protein
MNRGHSGIPLQGTPAPEDMARITGIGNEGHGAGRICRKRPGLTSPATGERYKENVPEIVCRIGEQLNSHAARQ